MGNDTLEQRGSIFLFLRYLGDHLGNTIYKSIVQSNSVCTACVAKVTGGAFKKTFELETRTGHKEPIFKFLVNADLLDCGLPPIRKTVFHSALERAPEKLS